MGRELRRVPSDWEHPKGWDGRYKPLLDASYTVECEEWLAGLVAWENGEDTDRADYESSVGHRVYWWEWHGSSPNRELYRPEWPEETRTAYQVYENVTEGTPISPVFERREDVVTWLISQGYSEQAAMSFVEDGWALSGLIIQAGPNAGFYQDIHSKGIIPNRDD